METSLKRILCVDDDPETCNLYKMILYDYEVMAVATVAETLMMARKYPVDLYLLDAGLPDGSGIGLCREIRLFDPNTPILFVSGAVDETQDRAIKAGAQAYLIKPVPMFDLQTVTETLIRQATCRSLEARCTELLAVREAIQEYTSNLDGRLRRRNGTSDEMLRNTGYTAFIRAGGSRVEFERFWPAALDELNGSWPAEDS
jgi:DNA-binding response OmpR family regulator